MLPYQSFDCSIAVSLSNMFFQLNLQNLKAALQCSGGALRVLSLVLFWVRHSTVISFVLFYGLQSALTAFSDVNTAGTLVGFLPPGPKTKCFSWHHEAPRQFRPTCLHLWIGALIHSGAASQAFCCSRLQKHSSYINALLHSLASHLPAET